MAFIGGYHQDYRYKRNIGGTLPIEIENVTSLVPFYALLTGKQEWNELNNEIKYTNIILACSLAYMVNLF